MSKIICKICKHHSYCDTSIYYPVTGNCSYFNLDWKIISDVEQDKIVEFLSKMIKRNKL